MKVYDRVIFERLAQEIRSAAGIARDIELAAMTGASSLNFNWQKIDRLLQSLESLGDFADSLASEGGDIETAASRVWLADVRERLLGREPASAEAGIAEFF